jgi:hypothetical protein
MANETVGTMKDRVAIITGGSRGLGRNTAPSDGQTFRNPVR